MLIVVAEAHQLDERLELFARLGAVGAVQVAPRLELSSGHHGLLHPRQDRGGQQSGPCAHQHEQRTGPRLLENLEQGVGGLGVHLLGQPHQHGLVAPLETFKSQLADHLVGLFFGDQTLKVFQAQGVVPHLFVEVSARLGDYFPPLGQESIAGDRLAALFSLFVDRHHEV